MENFEKPSRQPADKKENKEKERVRWAPEEGSERIVIEREFIEQLNFKDKEARNKWIGENSKKLAAILDEYKDDFLKLHKADPGALFAIIGQLLEKGGEK